MITMTFTQALPQAPDLQSDDYCVLGLATCFIREDGETHEVQVIEPIPSSALEALFHGIPTSYQWAIAATVENFLTNDVAQLPGAFPPHAQFCDYFSDRLIAATRTYKKRPEAKTLIPQGDRYANFNHSLARKRVLNSENLVRPEDNVKQHAYTHEIL